MVITNDSSTLDLKYKFKDSQNFGTLFPTESLSLYFWAKQIIVVGAGNYRIWVYG